MQTNFQRSYQEQSLSHPLYPTSEPRTQGYLQVSSVHKIYYATYGNPDGLPVVVLHGGPGGGCSDGMTQTFDLKHWNVIMLDQRGAMRSEPFTCMENNTSQYLVDDLEKLRNHLGIDQWTVFGGSWGSALALLYSQTHPDVCNGLILRGVWLCRKKDADHLLYEMGKFFPETYHTALEIIPANEQGDLLQAYSKRVFDPDPKIHMEAAKTFIHFDLACATHLPNSKLSGFIEKNGKLCISVMRAFCHYAKHEFFLKPNQLLKDMHKIAHIPTLIIQGRWDAICPPHMAYDVYQKHPNAQLWIIPDGGHTATEQPIAAALATATDFFIQYHKRQRSTPESE